MTDPNELQETYRQLTELQEDCLDLTEQIQALLSD